jgi:FtsH-binding integral membrane protein
MDCQAGKLYLLLCKGLFGSCGSSGATQGDENLELKQWTLLYIGAIISAIGCAYVVYHITSTGDPSIEWVFWVFFGITLSLIAGGYYIERDYRKKHGEAGLSDWEDILREEDSS